MTFWEFSGRRHRGSTKQTKRLPVTSFLQVIAIHDFLVNVVELTANWRLACKGAALLLWGRLFFLGI